MPVNLEQWRKIYERVMRSNDFVEGENILSIEDVNIVTIKERSLLRIDTDKGALWLDTAFKDRIKYVNKRLNGLLDNPNELIGKKIKIVFQMNQNNKLVPRWGTIEIVKETTNNPHQEVNNTNEVPF